MSFSRMFEAVRFWIKIEGIRLRRIADKYQEHDLLLSGVKKARENEGDLEQIERCIND